MNKQESSTARVPGLVPHAVQWLESPRASGCRGRLTTIGSRARIARRARAYIDENYDQVVNLEDLCRATRVGVRTLQRAFRAHFDLTISEYLKTVRLDGARRELAVANPQESSVTRIALQQGFGHLGRFSVMYRERFGESPRETLRTAAALAASAPGAGRSLSERRDVCSGRG